MDERERMVIRVMMLAHIRLDTSLIMGSCL